MRAVVVGLGNPILRDDGVGWYVVRELRNQMAGQPEATVEVELDEVAASGLALMERLVGYDCAVLVDAIQTKYGVPGTLYRLTMEDLPTAHADSGHDASFKAALELGRRLGARLPTRIVIYAIEAANLCDFGEVLSAQVAAGAGSAVQAVLAEIRSLAARKG
jgi:hydrogenase maturation protease